MRFKRAALTKPLQQTVNLALHISLCNYNVSGVVNELCGIDAMNVSRVEDPRLQTSHAALWLDLDSWRECSASSMLPGFVCASPTAAGV